MIDPTLPTHPQSLSPLFFLGWSAGRAYVGYLPGEYYGYLPFFFGLATVYVGLGVVWMVVCMTYIKVKCVVGSIRPFVHPLLACGRQ